MKTTEIENNDEKSQSNTGMIETLYRSVGIYMWEMVTWVTS